MQVKDAGTVAKKWAARAGAAGGDYAAGVNAPRTDWAQATENAAQSWAAGTAMAATNGSFSKGVAKAGTDKWKRKASGVGAQRYTGGVAAAQPDFQNAIAPVLQVLSTVILPPRAPKGDPANLQRVAAIDTALRKLKTGS
jgi:hypothetical protein